MDNLVLRGRDDGYELDVLADRSFDACMIDMNNLLQKLQAKADADHQIAFSIRTGQRLLNQEQKQRIVDLFARFDAFTISELKAEVADQPTVAAILKAHKVNFVPQTIRSGQELFFDGDVVLLGNLHQGAKLAASKNVFVLGAAQGIIHAGYPDNNEAIIAGNLSAATQLRISDIIEVIDDDTATQAQQFAYIDDLHKLALANLSQLKQEKPKLYQQMEAQ